jgi:hypothetical protein
LLPRLLLLLQWRRLVLLLLARQLTLLCCCRLAGLPAADAAAAVGQCCWQSGLVWWG